MCIDKEFSLYPLLLLNFTANDSYVIEIILSLYLFKKKYAYIIYWDEKQICFPPSNLISNNTNLVITVLFKDLTKRTMQVSRKTNKQKTHKV